MKPGDHILNELRAISPVVADVPYRNVFSVHEGYFEDMETELSARISAERFQSKNVFSVPEGYFESLEGSILQKIKAGEQETAAEEIRSISPVLADIGNRNIFTVPQGYFEQLNFVAQETTQAKIIRMNPARSVFRYAAAAVITGLLGISVINIVDKTASNENSITFVKSSPEVLADANKIVKTGSFDQELSKLSDKEIEEYLEESGQDVNAALVASSANTDTKLPDAADYLLDENTLDNYLKDNNLKN